MYYEYGYLTRDMINDIEVQVEYNNRKLIDEIKRYNRTVPECKRRKMILEFGRKMYLLMQIIIAVVIMIKNYLDVAINSSDADVYIYVFALIYAIGMYVLVSMKQDFNVIVHGVFGAILLFVGFNYIFMIPINMIVCKLLNMKHLELIECFGYPNFHEVKIVFLDKETIELMDIHANRFEAW